MHTRTLALVLAAGATLSGCVTAPVSSAPEYETATNDGFTRIRTATDPADRDRLAIVAMTGEYRVDFHFAETVRLRDGYERHDDKNTGGFETVIAVTETPDHIVLQHILVAPGGHVVKHWRQDWHYEASQRFEFTSDQTWSMRTLDKQKTRGAWTQCVYEVSDAPRYCGTGRWNHRYGVSTWTSDRTWRPLPRREYTKRDDYNAINAENRHTITPQGWTHEQDNTKVRRDGEHTDAVLVREFGYNDYQRIDGFDFGPGYDYWANTASYWSRVRDAWLHRFADAQTLTLNTTVDGMVIIAGTFEQAARAATTDAITQTREIDALLSKWTRVSRAAVGASAAHADDAP